MGPGGTALNFGGEADVELSAFSSINVAPALLANINTSGGVINGLADGNNSANTAQQPLFLPTVYSGPVPPLGAGQNIHLETPWYPLNNVGTAATTAGAQNQTKPTIYVGVNCSVGGGFTLKYTDFRAHARE